MKRAPWHILAFMCDRRFNVLASELLCVIETTDILKFAPQSVASLSTGDAMEANGCLQFVVRFGMSTTHRQATVGETEGLIESVLHALDTQFIHACEIAKSLLLHSLSVLVAKSSPAVCERFIRNGGFRIVNHVFVCIHQFGLLLQSKGTTFGSVENGVFHGALSALHGMFTACLEVASTATRLPKTMFSYEPAALIQTTSALHEFCTLSDDPEFGQATIVLIEQFFLFVEGLHPESLEFVLLYRGKKLSPTTYSGKPMIIHAILIIRDSRFKHFAESVQDDVLEFSNRFPAVDKMIRDILSKEPAVVPASGPIPKVCALPGCVASSIGSKLMMQCSRCRTVYYCGVEHQREHWKAHKLVCKPFK